MPWRRQWDRGGRNDLFSKRGGIVLVALTAACVLASRPSTAMTFTCMESSKYKYIVKLFDDDPRKLADALGIDPRHAPPLEACRTALATGGTVPDDAQRLANLIIENRGWLDTIYLNSGGGEVSGAGQSAMLVRDFWLNTNLMPYTNGLLYDPADIGIYKSAREDGAVRAFEFSVTGKGTKSPHGEWCASACTFLLAAGVSRSGVAHLHRCGTGGDTIEAMSQGTDRCLAGPVNRLYTRFGTGSVFADTALTTPKETTTAMTVPRFAPTVQDALDERCKSDGAQLDDLKALLEYDLQGRGTLQQFSGQHDLSDALTHAEANRRVTEACIRRHHDHDRLAAFAKLCGRRCSPKSLRDMAVRELNQ